MAKIYFIFGTRPECVKLAPVIEAFRKAGLREALTLVNTGQQKQLVEQTLTRFGIEPDITLDVMIPGQSLNELHARLLVQLQDVVSGTGELALLLGQGDTATAFAACLTAFHNKIPFAHVEAGLRSRDLENPFPEELYRRFISMYASVHFAPTESARCNLRSEGIGDAEIIVTGNTVVDALALLKDSPGLGTDSGPALNLCDYRKLVLITCHRRENIGVNVQAIAATVKRLATHYPDYHFTWLLHPNPWIRESISQVALTEHANVTLHDPIDYFDLLRLYPHTSLILTDSGGIQEEAPSFGIPVIVLRETTERIESIEQGYAALCGADSQKIENAFSQMMSSPPSVTHNPYGDGHAAERIAAWLQKFIRARNQLRARA